MVNPYRTDANVTEAEGLNLWNKATKGIDVEDRYALSQAGIYGFKEALYEDNSVFWSHS